MISECLDEFDRDEREAPPPTRNRSADSSLPDDVLAGLDPALRETLEKLQSTIGTSPDQEPSEEQIAQITQQFEALSGNGEFQGMMKEVLQQLLSKDVLYEPMKEISKLV